MINYQKKHINFIYSCNTLTFKRLHLYSRRSALVKKYYYAIYESKVIGLHIKMRSFI
ncbi:unknown [Prevotella sp. CAG:1185]|nr:unknown [Prevotella sp. CAG:1185]